MAQEVELIRHFLSTIAYRFQKAINDCSQSYPTYTCGNGVRTPHEILNHMTHVLLYLKERLKGNSVTHRIDPPSLLDWKQEIERFHQQLGDVDKLLLNINSSRDVQKILLQGPLSDIMTHIGQLAMIRRMSLDPILGENFTKSIIETGHNSKNQKLP